VDRVRSDVLPDSPAGVGPDTARRHNEDLTESFLQDCQDRGMTPETLHTYRWNVEDFLNYLNGKIPEEVGRMELKGYLDLLRGRCVSKKTAGLYFAALKTFYDYLVYEELISSNPIDPIRKRYLQSYKNNGLNHTHKIISVEEAAALVNSLVDIRDKALVILLFKTGVRKRELIAMDVEDINWQEQSITLKPTAKRTNRIVFFDYESEQYLRRWLKARAHRAKPGERALFVGTKGRLEKGGVHKVIVQAALRIGLHDPESPDMEDHFSAHCARHWFTTHLIRARMSREFVKELRGDVRREAIDIYSHIDKKELRESYLACIPQLGV
jgi:integrase/recombinase XerD